jgi:hypothetical protein
MRCGVTFSAGEAVQTKLGDPNFWNVPARKQEQRALLRFILVMCGDHVSERLHL